MYKEKTVAVVVPAYNEEKLIAKTIMSIPDLVDRIIVVNDASTDRTTEIVEEKAKENPRVSLVGHNVNQGVGGAIVTGYKRARDLEMDITVVINKVRWKMPSVTINKFTGTNVQNAKKKGHKHQGGIVCREIFVDPAQDDIRRQLFRCLHLDEGFGDCHK